MLKTRKGPPPTPPPGLLARPLRPYAEIFRIPGAWRFSTAAIIGRMPMSMFGLGTVLLISAATGKYGVAGAVAASVPSATRFPPRGRAPGGLPWPAAGAAAAAHRVCPGTTALIVAVQSHLPIWVVFVPGAIAGAAMPSLGTMVRARWSGLLAGSPRLHAAFSFESVADELCFVIGHAAVTLLATEVFPASGVGVAALLCIAGTLWFAAQRGTEPVIVQAEKRPAAAGRRGSLPSRAPRVRGAAAPGLVVLGPVYLLLGAMFVSVDLSTVAFAQHFGHKPLAGFILGTYALGSATGGLWSGRGNGGRRSRRGSRSRSS